MDKRGRALHNSTTRGSTSDLQSNAMKRSQSKAEGMSESARKTALSGMLLYWNKRVIIKSRINRLFFISGDASMRRSKSRGDGLNRH